VYRVALAGLNFYLKHYRLNNFRTQIAQFFRPAKAQMEFDRALQIADRNVATAAPLGLGERQGGPFSGESFLITQSLEETESISLFIQKTLPTYESSRATRVRLRLAVALGEFVAHLHNGGVIHRDLHADNILVRVDEDDRPQLFLIDLHDVNFGRPLRWRASRENLVLLNRFFILRVGRTDRQRFWRAYFKARNRLSGLPTGIECGRSTAGKDPRSLALAREVEARTWRSNLRFWRRRDRRCLATNRYFQKVRVGRISGFAVRDLEAHVLKEWMSDPDRVFHTAGAKFLKNSRSSTVADIELHLSGGASRAIYKRFSVTSWTDPWLALFRRPAALRSWIYGHGLRDRWLRTARPLAVFARRRTGLSYEWYLVTEKIDDAVDLHVFLDRLKGLDPATARSTFRKRIDQLARLARELHRRHISYRDFKAVNLLVAQDAVWLIDLVGIAPCRRLSHARRVQNLARLSASFARSPSLSRSDKLRFLRVYMEWGIRGRLGWKEWWREIDEATRKKIKRNNRSGRPLA
jgi:tRNA A-37 threonylcarbamoyl transferase component Bud32